MPYFKFSIPRCDEIPSRKHPNRWTDLSFLNTQTPKYEGRKMNYICQMQFSFVICGSDYKRYIGYAFDSCNFNVEESNDDDDDNGDDEALSDEEPEDPIASCDDSQEETDAASFIVNANHPIWDPRAYFPMILEKRIANILRHWVTVVDAVESGIYEYVCHLSFTTLSHSFPFFFLGEGWGSRPVGWKGQRSRGWLQ